MKKLQKLSLLCIPVLAMTILTGCGKVAQSVNEGISLITSTLTGTISVTQTDASKVNSGTTTSSSMMSQSKLSSIKSNYLQGLSSQSTADGGMVRVYKINDMGEPVFTNITANVVNGEYQIPDLAEGNYIIEYVKVGNDNLGNAWKLAEKAYVCINSDGQVSADITPLTGAGAEYVVQEVFDAINGNAIDKNVADDVYDKAINAYGQAISNGDVIKDSNVQRVTASDDVTDTAYKKIYGDDSLNAIANDTNVNNKTKEAKINARINKSDMTLDEAKQLIKDVFGVTAGGGSKDNVSDNGPPEFFIEKFAEAYLNGVTITIEDFAEAYNGSVVNSTLRDTYLTKENVIASLCYVINYGELKELYDIYDGIISDDPNIPIAAKVVFPSDHRLNIPNVDHTQILNVPQSIILFQLSGLMDGSKLPSEAQALIGSMGIPFEPYSFCQQIGWMTLEDDSIYITETELRPVKTWIEVASDNWQPVDALEARVSVLKNNTSTVIGTVTLEYPLQGGGTGLVSMTYFDYSGMGGSSQQEMSSATTFKSSMTAQQINAYNGAVSGQSGGTEEKCYVIVPWEHNDQNITPQVIQNFGAGDATIKVYDSDSNLIAQATKQIIKLDLTPINWKFPVGPRMEYIASQNWDPDFVPQELDVDSSTQKARLKASWETPAGTIPEGYELAYSLNLGLQYMKYNWSNPVNFPAGDYEWEDTEGNSKWQYIWSSWQDGRFIKGNSFAFRDELERTTKDLVNNYQTRYELNITPLLIDKSNGRVVWQGSDSRTEFYVGKTTPWSITLNGTITFPTNFLDRAPRDASGNYLSGTWKVGLFKNGEPGSNGEWINYFWTDTNGGRAPVTGADLQPMIDVIGNHTDIADAGYSVNYSLTPFTKADNVIEKHKSYQLYIWYDFDEVPTNWDQQAWDEYGSPIDGEIDFYSGSASDYFYPLEWVESFHGDIWMDQSGVRYNLWSESGYDWKELSEIPANQTIDLDMGKYWYGN